MPRAAFGRRIRTSFAVAVLAVALLWPAHERGLAQAQALPQAQPQPTSPPTPQPRPDATDARLAALRRHPLACRPPGDDRTLVVVAGETLNGRTVAMLEAAQAMYGGPGDLLRIVQGSYTDGVPGSFGTHAGGGAVDISIRDPLAPATRLYGEVEAMVLALRLAGFAAWYRGPDAVYPGSVPHLHAVAVGDPELSAAARRQVDGAEGYLWGYDGLPVGGDGVAGTGTATSGAVGTAASAVGAAPGTATSAATPAPEAVPARDPHGGPVVCAWMRGGARPRGTVRWVRPE